MTTQERISKLEGLLARIQRNTRGSHPVIPTASPVAAPTAYAPQPAPPPVAFAAPAPLPVAPPIQSVATPPMPYAVPIPASADQALDELLSPAPEGSSLSVDIDVSLDTIPPVAERASQAPEAEPIPLVSVATEQPAPPPIDDAFGLESEVSEVRFAAGPRDSSVEVTVSAIEAEVDDIIGTEELSEADLVELTESQPPAAAAPDVDIDFDEEDEDERAPASSQRSKVASNMDEALAAAAAQHEAEREIPIKTPPPESGPQEAPVVVGMPPAAGADVDALLDQELEIPTRAGAFTTSSPGPTAEQLGQTIELDEPRGPSLELAEPSLSAQPAASFEELEVALPPREVVGGYDDALLPPPEARDELEQHRRRREDDLAPPPESLAELPPPPALLAPELIARPAPTGSAESFTSVREAFRPASFVELLDASLRLGA